MAEDARAMFLEARGRGVERVRARVGLHELAQPERQHVVGGLGALLGGLALWCQAFNCRAGAGAGGEWFGYGCCCWLCWLCWLRRWEEAALGG